MKNPFNKGNLTFFKKIKTQRTAPSGAKGSAKGKGSGIRNKIIAAGSVCVASIVIVSLILTSSITALAAASLPEIERIIGNLRGTGTFTITEVYSDPADRFFGYYVDGQEPGIGDWRGEIANYTDPAARAAYVDGLYTILDNAGVIDGPVTWNGNYSEVRPWEDTSGREQLRLNDYEEAVLRGEMVRIDPDDEGATGSYGANYIYEPVEQFIGGDPAAPNPEAESFLPVERLDYEQPADYYFIDLTFSPNPVRFEIEEVLVLDENGEPNVISYETEYVLDENGERIVISSEDIYEEQEVPVLDGEGNPVFDGEGNPVTTTESVYIRTDYVYETQEVPVYETEVIVQPYYALNPGEPEGPDRVYLSTGVTVYSTGVYNSEEDVYEYGDIYRFAGILGVTEIDLRLDVYVILDYGLATAAPEPNEPPAGYYGATEYGWFIDASDAAADGARFKRTPVSYFYAGEGSGEFNLVEDENGGEITVYYNIVYYTGGFVNNNWFLRYVFDRESNDLSDFIGKVRVRSVSVSDFNADYANLVGSSQMLVLNKDISGLSGAAAIAIFNASTREGGAYKPVMFDYSLSDLDIELPVTQLVRALAGKPTDQGTVDTLPAIYGPVTPGNGVNDNIFWTDRTARQLLDDYDWEFPVGFEAVKEEIGDENFLRRQQGMSGDDLLREEITNATAIRYIINFGGRRIIVPIKEINVLEIQGGLTHSGSSPNESDLTVGKIREWIGDTVEPYQVETINITRMTTYEFVGKIEDLNEQYHMIYIGGTARGMNEEDDESRYNDSDMDGMVYTNIGDRYRVNTDDGEGNSLRGLRDGDEDGNVWYRLSGNDITPTKMQDIRDFASAGYPVIIDDRLIDSPGGTARIRVTSDSAGFNFTAIPPQGAEFESIQWLWNGEVIPGETSSTMTIAREEFTGDVGTEHNFHCDVTLNGRTERVGRVSVKMNNVFIPGTPPQPRIPTGSPCPGCGNTNAWSGRPGEYLQCDGSMQGTEENGWRWYCGLQFDDWTVGATNNDHQGWTPGTFTIPADAFSGGTDDRYEPQWQIDIASASYTFIFGDDDDSGTVKINEERVDNTSYMFDTLRSIIAKDNVYSGPMAASDSANVRRYLSLSKPEIEFNSGGYPTPYAMAADGTMNWLVDSNNQPTNVLRYDFEIRNHTEAVPHETTYDVELFLDLNGDGRYTGFEKQNDIVVRNQETNAVMARNADGRYTLSADTRYIVTKQMPQGAVGLFDWSLKVTKNDRIDSSNRSVRASETGYTRIRPGANDEPTEINILQIASSAIREGWPDVYFGFKNFQQRVNFEWQQRPISSAVANSSNTTGGSVAHYLQAKDGTYYEGVYGKLIADVDDFDINIYTVYADELDDLYYAINNRRSAADSENATVTGDQSTRLEGFLSEAWALLDDPPARELADLSFSGAANIEQSLTTVFDEFDMLIIGFDDSYGDMSAPASRAVVNFIDSGKAVLLAHDAISFMSNDSAGLTTYGLDSTPYLRDAMKMDRFGITSNSLDYELRTALRGGNALSLEQARRVLDSNYSVAWKPGSATDGFGTGTALTDVHGYSSHVLKWYNWTGSQTGNNNNPPATPGPFLSFMDTSFGENWGWGGVGRRTSRVTQLNEGKITTYPYNLNLNGGTLEVSETHAQWHTINMNLDDIVVWYCLSSNYYIHNDGANSFYIYNAGNVTYTGAGHSMTQGNTTGRNTADGSAHPSGTGQNTVNTSWYEASAWDYELNPGIYNEAQLFVNTMIAAYRAAPEDPQVTALDEDGNEIRYQLLPSDNTPSDRGGGVLAGELSSDNEHLAVYFRVIDGNLHANKSITLSLSYRRPGHDWVDVDAEAIRVTEQGGNNTDRNGNLLSGVTYKFILPGQVINALNSGGRDYAVDVRLNVVTTGIPNAPRQLIGHALVTVRRIELFELS